MKERKTPMRRCTGCLEMKNKKELIRIVRTPDTAEFSLDFTGKKSGRGAYVCNNKDCFEKAHKHKGLERSFKQAVPPNVYEALSKEFENNNGS